MRLEDEDVIMDESDADEDNGNGLSATVNRRKSARSGSITSPPPLPPPDFNPRAHTPVDVAEAVTPPIGSVIHSPTLAQAVHSPSIHQQLGDNGNGVSLAAAVASVAASSPSETLVRPQLKAFQRISNDSIGSPQSAESSASNTSNVSGVSEGGEHLAEAREQLLHSGESSRRDSLTQNSSERPSRAPFDFNVIAATPPSGPNFLEAQPPEAGPSQPRRIISPSDTVEYEDAGDMPAEHAWDSVWPAPGSSHRGPYVSDSMRPHFPTAPMSPFITPAFSPAIIPITSIPRKPPSPLIGPADPTSPTRSHQSSSHRPSQRDSRDSPVLSSTGALEEYNLRRRGSITSSGPLLSHSPPKSQPVSINTGRHQRSFSASSSPSLPVKSKFHHRELLDRIQDTPPGSPPSGPDRRSASMTKSRSSEKQANRSIDGLPRNSSPGLADSSAQEQLADVVSAPASPADLERPITKPLRPRGRSMSSLEGSPLTSISPRGTIEPAVSDVTEVRPALTNTSLPSVSSMSLPPIALPPPAPEASALPNITGDDGLLPSTSPIIAMLHNSAPPMPSPLFASLSRPAMMRRAMSDYDTTKNRAAAPPLHRSVSITAELDKSPKRPTTEADITSPTSPRMGGDADLARVRKSPRRSPSVLPSLTPLGTSGMQTGQSLPSTKDIPPLDTDDIPGTPLPAAGADHVGGVKLVDEGDVLPNMDFQMDVTFDDEGLNTLERIFLLSKSEFPFHRAYVARVLGDLLAEVDPCESVEYVLPLLSGFSMDEDETVKEAFASELHRILWYFYSTCRLITEETEHMEHQVADMHVEPTTETITITSEGMGVSDRPTAAEIAAAPVVPERQASILSGSSTGTSTSALNTSSYADTEVDTPASTTSDVPSTAYSPAEFVNPFADDIDPEKGWAKDMGPLVDRPTLAVNFFTPLLGSLLLNQNPTISESVRNGVVNLIGRLRYKVDPEMETWGSAATQKEADERRTFASQNGPHSHDLRPFDRDSRKMVEMELVHGIVVGMGQLSTDMPEGLFTETLEDGQRILEDYAHGHSEGGSDSMHPSQAEIFQEQLIAEATAGRATSMNLIGSLCSFYEGEEIEQYGFVEEVLRSGDGDISVRAEGAVAVSCLVKIAHLAQVYEMIPLFEQYMEDPTDHVRQSICLSLPAIAKRIEDKTYRREFTVRAVQTLASSGDDVRCAILEMLGEVIYVFDDDPDGPPVDLLEVYMDDMIGDQPIIDGDWDVVAAFNFPGVALTLGSNRWSELRSLYQRLQERAGDKIMRILAASLHELAKILTFDQVEQDLLTVYKRCLTCNDEIRERVYEHVDVIVTRVRPEVAWELFTDLAKAWKDGSLGGWRAREQLALHLPSFLETFSDVHQGEQVLEVLRDALLDPFAAVRDGVTKGIPPAYVILGDDSPVAAKFRHMLLDLGISSHYRRRLTFVRCLREFVKPPPNQHAFEEFFVPSLPRLSTDVVDIRLGLAQAIADLFVVGAYYGDQTGSVPNEIKNLARILRDDDSAEVRDTLRNVDLKGIHKGKGVPHEVHTTPQIDRSLRPDYTGKQSSRQSPSANSPGFDKSDSPRGKDKSPEGRSAPHRRPSAEVTEKMDGMQLDHGSISKDGEIQGDAELQDPFSISFSQATSPDSQS